ncbi:hypothetical protein [Streptomyces sp. IBSBF 2435]|uniref:hypothetical protein n=1 Tax=Streptomyces sp. IBSBF 2435 TaxID=2903531 RepID=UPI002FDC4E77
MSALIVLGPIAATLRLVAAALGLIAAGGHLTRRVRGARPREPDGPGAEPDRS